MNEDSKTNGDAPLWNSIIVPAAIVAVRGLFRAMVVRPAAVVTPAMFVLD